MNYSPIIPLAQYGPKAEELAGILYSLLKDQPQNQPPTNHLDWTPQLQPFIKELRHFEAEALVQGSHTVGQEFSGGLRLNHSFIVDLASRFDDAKELAKLEELLDNAKDQVTVTDVQKTVKLPITVIDAFFSMYERQGQGHKSKEIGISRYIPKR
jgi:hypothetical protein